MIEVTKDDLFYFLGRKTAEVEQLTNLLQQAEQIIKEQQAVIANLRVPAESPQAPEPPKE